MISPFGIEHGYPVSKSFSGGTFKPIAAMSRAERGGILGSYKQARGVSVSDNEFRQAHESIKDHFQQVVGLGGEGVRDTPYAHYGRAEGSTLRIGGKKTGKSIVIGNAPSEAARLHIVPHEAAHANVKRSSYRLHGQIQRDPEKIMREEARADWASGGHYSRHKINRSGSAYAAAARLQKKPPNRKMRGPARKNMWGERQNNQGGYGTMKATINAYLPHYNMTGERADKAITAYRELHDSMRAKGVPQPKRLPRDRPKRRTVLDSMRDGKPRKREPLW